MLEDNENICETLCVCEVCQPIVGVTKQAFHFLWAFLLNSFLNGQPRLQNFPALFDIKLLFGLFFFSPSVACHFE